MRPRLAWFSPLAPVRSGISAYTAELLPWLAPDYDIDVFVDAPAAGGPASGHDAAAPPRTGGPAPDAGVPGPAGTRVRPAHAFVSRHALSPYDLVVYQLGNAVCHDYMWPYLLRYPGLVVLHDAGLHHSRARSLLARGRKDDYRAEFRQAHPGVDPLVAEVAVAGFEGATYYLWPLNRLVLARSRLVAVHGEGLARLLRDDHPGLPVRAIRMGVRPVAAGAAGEDAGPHPAAAGTGPVFACYGLVTPEKRIPQVLRAFAAVAATTPSARLLLVGDTTPHYDVSAEVGALHLADRVTLTGFVPDEALDAWLRRADVCLNLRWPTARETSASWLRCLAAGKPTVITDLVHTTDVPTLDPRTWRVVHARPDAAAAMTPPDARAAVAVGIDILDEDHSLGLALKRLAADAPLREQLGRQAYAWWAAHHTLEHMAADYCAAIAEAMARPAPLPPADWPAHLMEDGRQRAKAIVAEFGVGVDVLDG